MDFKKSEESDYKQLIEKTQLWYAKDKTTTMQTEISRLLNYWSTKN